MTLYKPLMLIILFFSFPSFAFEFNGEEKEQERYINTLINIKHDEREGKEELDKIRRGALKEAALSYGMRGALYWSTKEINKQLESYTLYLAEIFNFKQFLIRGSDNSFVLPSVLTATVNNREITEDGKTIRAADQYYKIVSNTKFLSSAPLWQDYLLRVEYKPSPPPLSLMPKNELEENLWQKWVKEGWEDGIGQALLIFDHNLRRLERDIIGIVRFHELAEKGMISSPIISKSNLGITGGEESMRINDKVIRIVDEPKLIVDGNAWDSLIESE